MEELLQARVVGGDRMVGKIATHHLAKPPKRAHLADLGRLRIVRNCRTKANPRLRTGCPDVQHRLKLRLIVQRGKPD